MTKHPLTDEQSGSSSLIEFQIRQPKIICMCDFFGQGQMVILFHENGPYPVPNRWIRFWMTTFFNSKWNFDIDD